MTNPLRAPWDTPFELPPFDLIEDAHFAPALEEALEEARASIAAITDGSEPTFANTIEALSLADAPLEKALSPFFAVAGADSNEVREGLMRDFSPLLSAYSSEITANADLFARIETLWDARESLDLTDEQQRVLMLVHRNFVRSGAQLSGYAADRLAEVKQRLSVLGTQFTQNLLADERSWFMPLDDMAGLPEFVVQAATAAGEDKDAGGPVVTLSRSLIVPFLQFSERRDLREKAYEAWTSRGANGGETDNRALAAEILALRAERANLLGYDSFADYKLETEMAKTPDAVRALLMQVWEPAKSAAEADAQVLQATMHTDGETGPLEPWDWRYYSEKRRAEEHDLNEAELKPYLQLDRMIEAAFDCSNRLFGLEFA
ncbi:MAG: M3 family metallopeptidase, partial [Octadecabacter sp.]|nr:M3 family metallopeptidase [Octadecabacter sp.]